MSLLVESFVNILAEAEELPVDSPTISVKPDPTGLPGLVQWTKYLGWLMYGALGTCVASIFIGGGMWGFANFGGNAANANKGKQYVTGGAAGAIVVGLATTIVAALSQL